MSAAKKISAAPGADQELLEMLPVDSDITLELDDGTLPGHTAVLRMWCGVLRTALEAGVEEGGKLPLSGTSKQEWLKVAAFFYPVSASAAVTWDNVEVVLRVAAKYSINALLRRAAKFMAANIASVSWR